MYEQIDRVVRRILPDETLPLNPYLDAGNNPYVEFTYDLVGNKLTERDPNGNISTFSYTSRYWLDTVTDGAGGKTDFDYDKAGNQTAITDANGNTSYSFYDDLNRLVRTVNPYAQATSFDYDKAGNLVWQKDTNDHVTEWEPATSMMRTGIWWPRLMPRAK